MWVLYVRNSTLICQENAGCVMFHIAKDALRDLISFRGVISVKSIVAADVGKRLICVGGAAGLLARVVSSWRRTRISCLESVRVRFHGFPSCVELFVENCSQEEFRFLSSNNHITHFTYCREHPHASTGFYTPINQFYQEGLRLFIKVNYIISSVIGVSGFYLHTQLTQNLFFSSEVTTSDKLSTANNNYATYAKTRSFLSVKRAFIILFLIFNLAPSCFEKKMDMINENYIEKFHNYNIFLTMSSAFLKALHIHLFQL
jgi:hypothetical protein